MEWIERIKTYLTFSKDEALSILISALVLGFVFSFQEWSVTNLFIGILIAGLSLLFHITAQKIAALKVGFKAEYNLWWFGLLIPLILVFVSNGRLWWVIIPGGVSFSLLAGLRLGKFRYGLNYWPMGVIGLIGPIASIILATIFKQIDIWFFASSSIIFHKIFIFNLAYAVCQMLPIPPLDGHYMFYASRMWYAFLFGTILTYTILAIAFSVYSWIFALTAGGLIWLIYYIGFERKAWWG
ncbi:hypothetical protein GOV06_05790 [Candidatus Woesearchaeota archaeon]|nr:hypothetical protein [Candidatus Woesearchaeota archaeon]